LYEDFDSEATRANGGGWPGNMGWLDFSSTACLIPDLEDDVVDPSDLPRLVDANGSCWMPRLELMMAADSCFDTGN